MIDDDILLKCDEVRYNMNTSISVFSFLNCNIHKYNRLMPLDGDVNISF